VSDTKLEPRSALAGAISTARSRVTIESIEGLTIAHVAARKGQSQALRARLQELTGVAAPTASQFAAGKDISLLWAGPDQWLAMASGVNGRELERELREACTGLASVADQSDARSIVRVSGPMARATLAKGVPIDLHPRAFGAGSAAITHAAHIGVLLWKPDASDMYLLACPRSYAGSLWSWLSHAAAEYGITIN